MKEKGTLIIKGENGEELECDILFTFSSEETGKNYMVYTDRSVDDDGKMRAYASIYDPNDPNSKLEEVTTEREWKIISAILSSAGDDIRDSKEN